MPDMLLDMAKNQGYVKAECNAPGGMVMALVNEGKVPCIGCHAKCPHTIPEAETPER
jgi:hypothetical protein